MRHPRRPRPLPLAGAIMTALLSLQVQRAESQGLPPLAPNALPTNGQVVHGVATITQGGGAMLVQQSSGKLITNWDTFNIGSGGRVDFLQPSSSAMALNRVLSADPSRIFGQLNANGQVFLVNPSGVLFAPGARVNVGGLVASTLDISNADFAAGNFRFARVAGETGEVANEGEITTAERGYAALLGPRVRNAGSIVARLGTVAMAAGNAVTLDLHGDRLINLQITGAAAQALAANAGALRADGGLVVLAANSAGDPLATVLNNTGTVHATTLANNNGVIRLEGGAGGVVAVSGTLDASGRGAGQTGGAVKVLGDKVGLFDGARVDASGDAGGGTVLVGGNWQGSGTEQRASATFVGLEAKIAADAISSGNGGKVVVWADGTTRFAGHISARGGSVSGNGGQVETSGKEYLSITGAADAGAANGKGGDWLLDPRNVTIVATGGALAAGVFTPVADDAQIGADTIVAALNGGTNVSINTGSTGTQNGDISVNAAINYNGATNQSLTLTAARDINVAADIKATGTGKLDINLTGTAGRVQLGNNDATTEVIASNGASITIVGGGRSGTNAILMQGARLQSDAGAINMTATGTTVSAMSMQNAAVTNQILSTSGNITINANGNGGAAGLNITSGNNTIASQGGNISITGTSNGASNPINLSSTGTNEISTTGAGNITLAGTNTNATSDTANRGINITPSGGTVLLQVQNGTLALTATGGTGAGTSITNISPTGGAVTLRTTGSGNIVLTSNTVNLAAAAATLAFQNTGTGSLTLQPLTNGTSVGLGGGGGTFNLTAAELGFLNDGFSSITIGRATGTGAITVGAATFNDALTLRQASGGVTFTGALTLGANKLSINSGGGTIDSVQVASAGNISITGAGPVSFGNTAAGGTLDVTTSGAITQGAGSTITATGAATLAAGANDITLAETGNNFSTLSAGGANVTLRDTNALQLGNVTATGTLGIATDGALTQTGASAVTATGATTLAAGSANDITLAEAGNNFSTVGITSGNNVSLRDSGALTMAASGIAGTMTLRSNGAITQTGALTIAGGLNITTDQVAGDVTMNNAGAATTTLGDTKIGNNYSLTTAGNISQAGGTTLIIGNNFTVSGGSLPAAAAGNVIGGTDNSAGSGTVIKQVGIVDLSTKNIGSGAGNIVVAGNLNVQSLASADTIQAPVGAGTVAVNLGMANNIGGAIAITSSAPTVTPSGAAVATGILQNGAVLSVGGNAAFSAATSSANAGGTAGNITINGAGNTFGGPVSFSGHNVVLKSGSALTLGASSATGTLALQAASGSISSSNLITVGGTSSFTADAAGADVVLSNAGNSFGGSVTFAGAGGLSDINVTSAGALDLQALTLTGNLQAKAAGISDSGTFSVGGTTGLQATGDVILDNAGHQFTGAVTVSAANADLRANGALQLGAGTLTGNLALAAQGAITQSGALAVGGNLSLTTTHASGDVTLNNSGAATTKLGNATVGGDYNVVATGKAVTQDAGSAINVAGNFNSTAASTTTSPADNLIGGTDGTQGANTFIRQVGVITLGNISTGGNLTVLSQATGQSFAGPAVHGTAVNLSNAGNNIAGTVTVNTSAPAILAGGAPVATGIVQGAGTTVQVTGSSAFTAVGGDITLGNTGNSFGGAVSATGNNITLRGNGALLLGAVNAAGQLSAIAGSGITQNASGLGAGGTSSFDGGAGAIVLNTASNDFTGTVLLANTAGGISLTDTNTLALGTVNAAGALTLTAGGATTLNGDVAATGITFNGAGAGAVALAAHASLDGRTGTIAMGAMNGGAHNLTLTSDNLALAGNWSGTGAYVLRPFSDATTVGLAGGAGSFALSTAELADIANASSSQVTIGRATGTGAMTVGAMSFDDKLALQGGAVSFSAGSQAFGSGLSVQANGRVQLSGATVTATGGDITISGAGAGAAQGFSMLSGALLRTTSGSGNIAITGTNASGSAVSMAGGANTIQADGTGSITITGTAGGATGFGLTMGSGGTNTVRVANGTITVNAQSAGSDTATSLGSGTNLFDATGTGSISVTGAATGGGSGVSFATSGANSMRAASGNLNVSGSANGAGSGINLGSGAHTLASATGSVTLTGTSNGSGAGVGLGTGTNTVEAGGNGNVTVNAQSLGATGFGMSMGSSGTSTLRVANGALAINVTSAGDDTALTIGSGTNTVKATGTGSIAIVSVASGTANGISIGSGGANTLATGSGSLSINGTGSGDGSGIAMSSGTNAIMTGGGNIAIQAAGLGDGDGLALSNGTNVIAAGGAGNLAINATSGTGNALSLGTASKTAGTSTLRVTDGALTINASAAGSTSAVSFGVTSGASGPATNTIEATLGGSIAITAQNTGSGNAISMGSSSNNTIRTGAGAIAVTGTSAQASGISMASGNNAILSGGGGIALTGTSLGDGNGIGLATGTNLVAAGGAGNLTLNGVSQGSVEGFGLSLGTSGNNTLRVADGVLAVRAQSAGDGSAATMGSGTNNIEATGAGRIDIAGMGSGTGNGFAMSLGTNTVRTVSGRLDVNGTGSGGGEGISMGSGVNTIQSDSGAITLTGAALGTGHGFYITSSGKDSVLTHNGSITITGSSAAGDAIALRPNTEQATIEAAGAGNISFRADNYDAAPTGSGSVRIAGAGGVLSIVQLTPGVSIGIGEGASGLLNWSGAEVAQASGFSLVRIGNRESGALDLRPPWFPFPMELPPATLGAEQRRIAAVKTTVESLLSNLMAIGELPPTLQVTRRFSLLVQGFDDAAKR